MLKIPNISVCWVGHREKRKERVRDLPHGRSREGEGKREKKKKEEKKEKEKIK